jgi:CubicO group peptidase (beta-lactamase class C family)
VFRLSLLLLLAPLACLALDLEELERYLRAERDLNRIPGMSVALVEPGRVLHLQAYGVRDLSSGQPMRVDTPVELASVSKSFTALAVSQLLESVDLEIDAPLGRYLPELRGSALAPVTIQKLLRQTSGLTRRHDFLVPCCGAPGELDLRIAVRNLGSATPRSGEAFTYANSNYVLLAALIERVSGIPFPDYMEARVFLPLGLTRTTVSAPQARAWGLATLHEPWWGRMRLSEDSFRGWYGSSLVKSSASDLVPYLQFLLSRPLDLDPPYDRGWFPQRGGRNWIEHTGEIWGANAAIVLAPEHKLAVAVLINAGVSRAGPIARGILARAAGLPAPEPQATPLSRQLDFWSFFLLAGALLIFAGTALFTRRVLIQLRRGEREIVWNRLALARAVLLLAMSALLIYLPFNPAIPPLAAFPAGMRLALPLFTGAAVTLWIAAAVLGLLQRPRGMRVRRPGVPAGL